jgi:hypothetical protein
VGLELTFGIVDITGILNGQILNLSYYKKHLFILTTHPTHRGKFKKSIHAHLSDMENMKKVNLWVNEI